MNDMLVSELMQPALSAGPGDTVRTAACLLSRRNVGALPVVGAGGRLLGIVTDRDLVLRCLAAGLDPDKTPLRAVMTPAPRCAAPEDSLDRAAALMAADKVRRLPVAREGRLVGMLSLGDLARCRTYAMEAAQALTEISQGVTRASPPPKE